MKKDKKEGIRNHYAGLVDEYTNEYKPTYSKYPANQKRLLMLQDRLRALKPKTLLDCGCGEGSPVLKIHGMGIDVWAFDFVDGMIDKARVNAKRHGLEKRFWVGDITKASSFKPPSGRAPARFDVCIALGVFPHIDNELAALKNMSAALKPGGRVFIEFRNELFSLFTLNRYQDEFFERRLIRSEAVKKKFPETAAYIDQVTSEIKPSFRMDLPPVRRGDAQNPGYDEILSKFHNPFELSPMFSRAGLSIVGHYFYHYHAVPPMYEQRDPAAFKKLSLEMEKDYRDWRGYFMASAFVVEAVKMKQVSI